MQALEACVLAAPQPARFLCACKGWGESPGLCGGKGRRAHARGEMEETMKLRFLFLKYCLPKSLKNLVFRSGWLAPV